MTWSTLATAMVPAVVSGIPGYLTENPERQKPEPYKAALIRENTSRASGPPRTGSPLRGPGASSPPRSCESRGPGRLGWNEDRCWARAWIGTDPAGTP